MDEAEGCWQRSWRAESWPHAVPALPAPLTSAPERVLRVSPSSLSAQESLLIPHTMPGMLYCGTGKDRERLGMGI